MSVCVMESTPIITLIFSKTLNRGNEIEFPKRWQKLQMGNLIY
jgi:hypothetical protein